MNWIAERMKQKNLCEGGKQGEHMLATSARCADSMERCEFRMICPNDCSNFNDKHMKDWLTIYI